MVTAPTSEQTVEHASCLPALLPWMSQEVVQARRREVIEVILQAQASADTRDSKKPITSVLASLLLDYTPRRASHFPSLLAGPVCAPVATNPLVVLVRMRSSKAFVPSCGLSTQELVDLLKNPTCIGDGYRMVLEQLEIRYRRKFLDHWDFLRYARKQGIQLNLARAPTPPGSPT